MSAGYILLLGLPGTGKGTLAQRISDELPIAHISCGDVFRHHVATGTEFGQVAKAYIEKGQLTPDADTSRMFLEHLKGRAEGGTYLIEGFPRTVGQALDLQLHLVETGRKIVAIVSLDAPVDMLEERLLGRRLCPVCRRIYNLRTELPRKPGICDHDGQPLVQRADDKAEVIRPRIELYRKNEDAVTAFYQKKNLIHQIDASLDALRVLNSVRELVSKLLEANI